MHTLFFQEDEIANFVLNDKVVPKELHNIFQKFLVYEFKIHPLVRNKIASYNRFVEKMIYKIKDPNGKLTITNISLTNIEETDNNIESSVSYKKLYAGNSNLNDLYIKVVNGVKDKYIKSKKFYESEINSLMDNKQYLDAYLAFYEHVNYYDMQGGEGVMIDRGRLSNKLLKLAGKDSDSIKLVRTTLVSRDKVDQAVKFINDLRKQNLKYGYMLDIFLGYLMSQHSKYDYKYEEPYIELLNKQPFMIGIYLELKFIYALHDRAFNSYKCTEIAKLINPNHIRIEHHNQNTKERYPDYF